MDLFTLRAMDRYITVYNRFKIKQAITSLANRVYQLIECKGAENCILVTVLSGGAYLSHKVIDKLSQDMLVSLTTVDIKVSSYKGQERSQIVDEYIPHIDCKGKTVIVIDDFCDSGNTLNHLLQYFNSLQVDEVQFVTLLARKRRKCVEDLRLWYGIEDDTRNFYIGCGLDDNERSRYLDEIVMRISDEKEKG